jgi:hypothetical protein
VEDGEIGRCCRIKTEQILTTNYPTQEFTYIGLEHIESDTGKLIKYSRNFGKEIKSNKIKFQEGDILYDKLRPYLKRSGLHLFDRYLGPSSQKRVD